MYLLSLSKVPKFNFNKIKKKIFTIFRLEINVKISTRNTFGGWGVKNILCFGEALAMKILWIGLFGRGLWSEIIKEKYLRNNM